MGGGWVLDFNNQTFSDFFKEHGIEIDAPKYAVQGDSKAKRMRVFLRQTPPPLVGRVLAALYEYRAAMATTTKVSDARLTRYREIARRLDGVIPEPPPASSEVSKEYLMALAFRPEVLDQLELQLGLAEILKKRMAEAQICNANGAYLAAVILAGSVLEGLCLGCGILFPAEVHRAFDAQFKPPKVPNLPKWTLHEWVTVLESIQVLTPNVSKFGHALRELRNYVHPNAQLLSKFEPDEHTAKISFQVVVAAIDSFKSAKGVSQ